MAVKSGDGVDELGSGGGVCVAIRVYAGVPSLSFPHTSVRFHPVLRL